VSFDICCPNHGRDNSKILYPVYKDVEHKHILVCYDCNSRFRLEYGVIDPALGVYVNDEKPYAAIFLIKI